jgi:hypothetical protein
MFGVYDCFIDITSYVCDYRRYSGMNDFICLPVRKPISFISLGLSKCLFFYFRLMEYPGILVFIFKFIFSIYFRLHPPTHIQPHTHTRAHAHKTLAVSCCSCLYLAKFGSWLFFVCHKPRLY